MKQLLLVTTNNVLYNKALINDGYTVTEYELPVSDVGLEEIENLRSFDICITEVSEDIIDSNGRLFGILRKKGKVLCLAEQVGDIAKNFLLDHGISDLLKNPCTDILLPYLRIMNETTNGVSGSIVVLDDNDSVIKILSKIIGRFNYTPVFIGSVGELFSSAISSSVRFILVNLSTRSLDLNGLVRKFYGSQQAGLIPVLVYKDMREGLFVHELVSGLNRLTRFILGLDELYSFLVDILFKKEITPSVASIKKLSDFDNLSSYIDEAVNRIFFMNEKNIFNQANILNEKNFEDMMHLVHKMEQSLVMVHGLKWLKIGMDKKGVSIAGTEG